MFKRSHPRFIALLGTAAVTASLIGVAVVGTGAYFTDSHPGEIDGTNGTVAVTVSGGGGTGGLDFDFTGLLPGVPKTATVSVSNPTGNPEAVWLVFDNANGIWSAVNNLGQFGKFTVGGYVYDNLSNKYDALTPGVPGTPTGSYMTFPSCTTVPRVGVNYLPHAIKITTLPAWGSTSFNITFEYNACMTEHQLEAIFNPAGNDTGATISPGPLVFSIAAFQDGVDPTSPFNGAGAIVPLNLTPYGAFNKQYIQP